MSLNDPDARPIRKGRLGKPVEFGYKAQVVDNADGVILDHTVEQGAPADAPQLAPAIARVTRRAGKAPKAITADRGYGYASVEQDLHDHGVKKVVIPRQGKPGAARREFEHRRAFRDLVKWRTGCEGRISNLKRNYGWNRTPSPGSRAPASTADTAASPTTLSRSEPSQRETAPERETLPTEESRDQQSGTG